MENEVFKACLLVEKQDETICMDCRPSDGLVLAAQKEAQVLVTRQLMEQAGKVVDMRERAEEAFRNSLSQEELLTSAKGGEPIKETASLVSLLRETIRETTGLLPGGSDYR